MALQTFDDLWKTKPLGEDSWGDLDYEGWGRQNGYDWLRDVVRGVGGGAKNAVDDATKTIYTSAPLGNEEDGTVGGWAELFGVGSSPYTRFSSQDQFNQFLNHYGVDFNGEKYLPKNIVYQYQQNVPDGSSGSWSDALSSVITAAGPFILPALVAGGQALAGGALAGGGGATAGAGGLTGDALGLAQMGQAAGLSGSALESFVASGGALGSTAAGGGGVGLGALSGGSAATGGTAGSVDLGSGATGLTEGATLASESGFVPGSFEIGQSALGTTAGGALGTTAATTAGSTVADQILSGASEGVGDAGGEIPAGFDLKNYVTNGALDLAKLLADPAAKNILSGLLQGGLGYAASENQTNLMRDIYNTQRADRMPALNAFNSALANPDEWYKSAPAMGAADATLRKLSMEDGNPANNPGLLSMSAANNLGGYRDYLSGLTPAAFGTAATEAGVGAGAANAAGGGWEAIGAGVKTALGNANTYEAYLKALTDNMKLSVGGKPV